MPLRPTRFSTKKPHLAKKARGLVRRGKFIDHATLDPASEKTILDDGSLFIRRTVPSAANVVIGPLTAVIGKSASGVGGSLGSSSKRVGSGPMANAGIEDSERAPGGLLGSWRSMLSSLPRNALSHSRSVDQPPLPTTACETQIPPHRHTRRPSLLLDSQDLRSVVRDPLPIDALRDMRLKRAEDPSRWSTTALAKHFQVSRHFVSMAAPLGRPASGLYTAADEARASNLSAKSLERAKTLQWEDETRQRSWGKVKTAARNDRQRRRARW